MPEFVCCCLVPHDGEKRRHLSGAELHHFTGTGLIHFCATCTEQSPDVPGGIYHADEDAGFCMTCITPFALGPGLLPTQCAACAAFEACAAVSHLVH